MPTPAVDLGVPSVKAAAEPRISVPCGSSALPDVGKLCAIRGLGGYWGSPFELLQAALLLEAGGRSGSGSDCAAETADRHGGLASQVVSPGRATPFPFPCPSAAL